MQTLGLFGLSVLCVSHAEPSNTIEIAPGVFMPYANLGGVRSRPSNYSEWLTLGGRGLDTALTCQLFVYVQTGNKSQLY